MNSFLGRPERFSKVDFKRKVILLSPFTHCWGRVSFSTLEYFFKLGPLTVIHPEELTKPDDKGPCKATMSPRRYLLWVAVKERKLSYHIMSI